MIWLRVPYDDGDGYYWNCNVGRFGELCVDSVKGGWQAYCFNNGADTVIGVYMDEDDGKLWAEGWLRLGCIEAENALVQGCIVVDEE